MDDNQKKEKEELLFFPRYLGTLETLLKPEAASFAYSVNGLTKVQMSPQINHPMLAIFFSISSEAAIFQMEYKIYS